MTTFCQSNNPFPIDIRTRTGSELGTYQGALEKICPFTRSREKPWIFNPVGIGKESDLVLQMKTFEVGS